MTLRRRILGTSETYSDFAFTADDRFADGAVLIRHGRFSGATYALGIACEMYLKLAAIRCHDRRIAASTAVAATFGPIRAWMRRYCAAIDHEAYHSLAFWAEFIVRYRETTGLALTSELAGELRHHVVRRTFQDWKIDMRYRWIPISETHATRVYRDVSWVRQNWDRLWR